MPSIGVHRRKRRQTSLNVAGVITPLTWFVDDIAPGASTTNITLVFRASKPAVNLDQMPGIMGSAREQTLTPAMLPLIYVSHLVGTDGVAVTFLWNEVWDLTNSWGIFMPQEWRGVVGPQGQVPGAPEQSANGTPDPGVAFHAAVAIF